MKRKTSVIIECKRHIGTNLKSWYFTLQQSIYLSIDLSIYLSIYLYIYIPAENIIPVQTFFFNDDWIFWHIYVWLQHAQNFMQYAVIKIYACLIDFCNEFHDSLTKFLWHCHYRQKIKFCFEKYARGWV